MLSDKQIKAAWLKGHGRADTAVIAAVEVHKTTYYRWLKTAEFAEAVKEVQAKIATENKISPDEAAADLADARESDRKVLLIQRDLLNEVSAFTLDMIRHIREQGVENFSVRAFPALCRTTLEVSAAMQATADRLVGIDALLEDIERLDAALATAESAGGRDD